MELGRTVSGVSISRSITGESVDADDRQQRARDEAERQQRVDGLLHAVVVLRAEIARDDHARTHRNAVDQTDHQENQVAGGADRGQRLAAQKVADDQRIRRVVQLLKQVAQKQREREGDQRLRRSGLR